jgi:hypothetical protein
MSLMHAVAADWGFNEHLDDKGMKTDGSKIKHIYGGVIPWQIAAKEATRVRAPDWYRNGTLDDLL